MTTLIQTQRLTRDFTTATGSTVRAVDDLTLEIPAGIVFGFLGPNGSGKTTTIRLLLGLLDPTQGSAKVFGYDTRAQADAIRAQTGALLEHTGLYERLTAEDNLQFYGRVYRMSSAERQARTQELLSHMGLWERRKEVVSSWSRGMKQKLAIARALMHRPKLIFLDEPTAGLDPVAAAALREDLASLSRDAQTTIFLTTHNLVDAERLCQQVAVIREGRTLAVGSPDALRSRGSSQSAEILGRGFTPDLVARVRALPVVNDVRQVNGGLAIDTPPNTDLSPIVTLLVTSGVQIDEVRKNKASLEDIFLELVEETAKEG